MIIGGAFFGVLAPGGFVASVASTVLAPGGSWWLLVAPGGSWWLLVAPGGSWWLRWLLVASVASVASVAPGGSWWLL